MTTHTDAGRNAGRMRDAMQTRCEHARTPGCRGRGRGRGRVRGVTTPRKSLCLCEVSGVQVTL